ncbi:MAG: protein phosphatase 2C domain-containing protein [Burkholderiales bacterium]|nr:protein phosphatase 2C domain-containing protein [Burkholderiales bacterium]
MNYELFQASRIGARREQQDRLGHWSSGEALLLALADGMGGHVRGELAATVAVETLGAAFRAEARPRLADPAAFLARAVARAHAAIAQRGRELGLGDSPRTTLVACVVQEGRAWWTHVGDSRLYLIRDGRVAARTRDHSVVQRLVDAGRIREEAVAAHPDRHKLLACLGGPVAPRLEPPASAALVAGDLVLLCSDGFWAPLSERQLLTALIGRRAQEALAALVRLAEVRAGRDADNLSVLALDWRGPDGSGATTAAAGAEPLEATRE